MSQYYTRPPRPYHTSSSSSASASAPTHSAELEDSIYIFPNPSSIADPATSSVTTDHASAVYQSAISRRGHREGSTPRSDASYVSLGVGSTTATTRSPISVVEADLWDELELELEDTLSDNFEPLDLSPPASRLALPLRPARLQDRRPAQTRSRAPSTVSYMSLDDDAPSPHPHPAIRTRVPLLNLFAAFLGVDDDTLRLLTTPAQRGAVLFPGHALPQSIEQDGEPGVHGLQKLLLTNASRESESWRSLRAGLAVVYDYQTAPISFPVPVPGIAKLWGLVGQVWKGGKGLVVRAGG